MLSVSYTHGVSRTHSVLHKHTHGVVHTHGASRTHRVSYTRTGPHAHARCLTHTQFYLLNYIGLENILATNATNRSVINYQNYLMWIHLWIVFYSQKVVFSSKIAPQNHAQFPSFLLRLPRLKKMVASDYLVRKVNFPRHLASLTLRKMRFLAIKSSFGDHTLQKYVEETWLHTCMPIFAR